MKRKEIIGMKYGRLTVIERIEGSNYYHCQCDCGNEKKVRRDGLTTGNTRSCGCLNREAIIKHGLSKVYPNLYSTWGNMRQRCNNPNHRDNADYGGRGIKVCPEWDSFKNFCEWSLANGYVKDDRSISIDRINNDGNYSPDNCRWTDRITQNNNRRCTVRTMVNNKDLTLKDIAEEYGINHETVKSRYNRGLRGEDLIKPVVLRGLPT
ncbi:sigma factor-like helix-turn-helix DNA-binding protein [Ammoniphilus sp. CFH 90114]|uniref:sigma factor-like helix-turn-helix DNA-binding protein n=1 Tax=Ammoniphilus sp. CFH 90114 TaxID=2493665 RepID=UPI0013E94102|nr:sigma factor-like helix-turn-helix DNA-binding protein [Ammoniphilus sp. CFH 90114]